MVQADLEIATRVSVIGVPRKLTDVPLVTVTVSGAGTHRIDAPVTAEVLRHAASGLATFEFFARFGDREATSMASLPVAPGPDAAASAAGLASLGATTVTFSPFRTVPAVRPDVVPPPCVWTADGSPVEKSNRIGQMQDSSGRGSKAAWNYSTEADSTFGVGVSGSLTANYSGDGSLTITNSIGASGGFTAGADFNRFVYGHFYRQRYESDMYLGHPICGHRYKTEYTTAVGDSYPQGTKKPGKDPYGRCSRDPYGLARMRAHGGYYDSDRGHATKYSGAAAMFNISVSGQTGYTNDIHIDLANNSSRTEYACGNADLPDAPKLWSNNSLGRQCAPGGWPGPAWRQCWPRSWPGWPPGAAAACPAWTAASTRVARQAFRCCRASRPTTPGS
ncbi:MAG: hypothetical protein ACLP7J_12405 [Streptosporangiaceae bacterium]